MSKKAWIGIVVVLAVAALAWWGAPYLFPRTDEGAARIGAVLPLTGSSAQIGGWQRKGIDLALAQINQDGGIDGSPLQVIYEDSQGDPRAGIASLQKLLALSPAPAVFLSLSSVSNAALPVLDERKVVGMLLAVSLPGITSRSPWAFRCNLGSDDEARTMAAHLGTTSLRRIAVAYINDEFGVGALEVFREAAGDKGITVTAAEAYEKEATDFRTLIVKLRASNPDAVYVIGYVRSSVLLIKQMRELGVDTPVLGNMALSVPSFLELGGDALDGATFTVTQFDPASSRPRTRAFVDAYRERYGETPTFFAAFAYDATQMTADAMRRRGTSAEQVRQGLSEIRGYEGVMGTLTVLPNRDIEFPTRVVRNRGGALEPAGGMQR